MRQVCRSTAIPESYWHSLNLTVHLLGHGPNGPVATDALRASVKASRNARPASPSKRVLTDEALKAKLGAELAQKSQDVLDERLREDSRTGSEMGLSGRYYITGATLWDYYDGGGAAGQRWFVGSGWQDRDQKFYALAGEVVKKTGTAK
jgi:hypothetical protein